MNPSVDRSLGNLELEAADANAEAEMPGVVRLGWRDPMHW